MTAPPTRDPLVDDLRTIVGGEHVLVDADVRAGYETDWTQRYTGTARCVVRPADVAQVAAVVAACTRRDVPIVAQGGNTGLVGGSVPRRDAQQPAVVLSTRRLCAVGSVDVAAAAVTVGAGVTIEQLQLHARNAGLDFAVDWGARASATVGGAVATNAGGSRVVRFGTMRSQVLGVEAVLADGRVLTDLRGLPKETVGPHLPSLFTGSEGAFGVITAARLRLVPWYHAHTAAAVAVRSLDEAVGLLADLRRVPSLDAVEVLLADAVALTCAAFGFTAPLDLAATDRRGDTTAMVIVDCAAHVDPSEDLLAVLDARRGVLATGAQRTHLLDLRDHVSMAINATGVPLKLDVAVPVERLDELTRRAFDAVGQRAPAARLIAFGHLAEGNLHLNVLDAGEASAAITEDVLTMAVQLGGTVSAEHGIGVAKTAWLARAKGEVAADVLRAVKDALDPHGLMNPGVLFG